MTEAQYKLALYTIIGLFVALLIVNFLFRIRVLNIYQKLRREGVDFTFGHAFDRERLEHEVLQRYPEQRSDILKFLKYVRLSITMASILLLLIIALGSILMFYR